MRKNLLSLALALVMCLGLTVPAMAAGETTIQDSGGFSYTLSKPVIGTRVDDEYGATYYQIPEGTIITPVVPEGTVKDVAANLDSDYTNGRIVYKLPNGGGAVFYDLGTVYYGPGWLDCNTIGDLEGMFFFDKATPTQPLSTGKGELCISRLFSEEYDTHASEWSYNEVSYLYFEIIPDNGSTTPTVPTVGGFTDVKTGDYFAEPVLWAVEKGITAGTSATTFSPNQDCSVAQILTFLWRANGSPKPTGSNPFSDVKSGDYYAEAAVWAYEKGMVSGSTFGGNTPCTRSMAVTYMWKAAGSPNAGKSGFTDVPANANYAGAVAWAVEQGITSGTGNGQFSPASTCTRGQIVTFLYRAFAK